LKSARTSSVAVGPAFSLVAHANIAKCPQAETSVFGVASVAKLPIATAAAAGIAAFQRQFWRFTGQEALVEHRFGGLASAEAWRDCYALKAV